MVIVFCVEIPSEELSSCLGGLRSLLNTEGILTLPIFLFSDAVYDLVVAQ